MSKKKVIKMKDQVYKKNGRRYIPIGYSDGFDGFPAEGIWLVEKGTGKKSSECILRVGELQDMRPYADIFYGARDKIINFISEQSKSGTINIVGVSYVDFVNNMLKEICKTI